MKRSTRFSVPCSWVGPVTMDVVTPEAAPNPADPRARRVALLAPRSAAERDRMPLWRILGEPK